MGDQNKPVFRAKIAGRELLNDLLSRLTLFVELPMPPWGFVRRVEDGVIKERVCHRQILVAYKGSHLAMTVDSISGVVGRLWRAISGASAKSEAKLNVSMVLDPFIDPERMDLMDGLTRLGVRVNNQLGLLALFSCGPVQAWRAFAPCPQRTVTRLSPPESAWPLPRSSVPAPA